VAALLAAVAELNAKLQPLYAAWATALLKREQFVEA